MKAVVVTSQRPWEVTKPLETTEVDMLTLLIDPEDSLPVRFFSTLYRTHQAIKNHDPDLLFLDVYDIPGLVATFVAKAHGVPVITRVVGDRIGELGSDRIRTRLENGNYGTAIVFKLMYVLSIPIFAISTGLVVVSKDLKAKMITQTRHTGNQICVVPVPFRDDAFDAEKHSDRSDTTQISILTVTNLEYRGKYDGARDALLGVESLVKECAVVDYRIAGTGAYKQDLEEYVDHALDQKTSELVDVLGYVVDIEREYRNADIFLYISYLDGYPNTVLEAQGMGLPVVTNRAKGMADQVNDGTSGLFVDPEDPDAIRSTLERLIDQPSLRMSLGREARQIVEKRNSPVRIGEQLEKSFERLLPK